MPALDEFVSQILGQQAQQEIAASNPYYSLKEVPDLVGQRAFSLAAQNPGKYGMGETALATGLSGLVSGLFGGIGDRHQDKLTDRYQDVASKAALGVVSDRSKSGLPSGLFGSAKRQGSLFRLKDQIANQQAEVEARKKLKEAYDLKFKTLSAEEDFLTNGSVSDAGMPPEEKPIATIAHPDSKAGKIQQTTFDMEKTLTNEFYKAGAGYRYRENGFRALVEAYKDESGTSDFEIVRRAAQSVEPKLAVRKDDQDSIEGAASIFGVSTAYLENVFKGKTKLSPEVRAGIMRIAARGLDSAAGDYNLIRKNIAARAESVGLKPDKVLAFPEAVHYKELAESLDTSIFDPVVNITQDDIKAELAKRGVQ